MGTDRVGLCVCLSVLLLGPLATDGFLWSAQGTGCLSLTKGTWQVALNWENTRGSGLHEARTKIEPSLNIHLACWYVLGPITSCVGYKTSRDLALSRVKQSNHLLP